MCVIGKTNENIPVITKPRAITSHCQDSSKMIPSKSYKIDILITEFLVKDTPIFKSIKIQITDNRYRISQKIDQNEKTLASFSYLSLNIISYYIYNHLS